jgi:hypothetical protein
VSSYVDRSSRRPEPVEPNRPSDQPSSLGAPVAPTVPDTVDRRSDREARRQPGATGHGDRTVEDRSTASAESGKDSPGSRLDGTQEDRADHSSTRPARDAADAADQRSRHDAATTEIAHSSSDSISTVQDASDRLPADWREKMLQDPVHASAGEPATSRQMSAPPRPTTTRSWSSPTSTTDSTPPTATRRLMSRRPSRWRTQPE